MLVAAAVRAGRKDIVDLERIHALYEAGCNIIVLDALNGDNELQLGIVVFFNVYFNLWMNSISIRFLEGY